MANAFKLAQAPAAAAAAAAVEAATAANVEEQHAIEQREEQRKIVSFASEDMVLDLMSNGDKKPAAKADKPINENVEESYFSIA